MNANEQTERAGGRELVYLLALLLAIELWEKIFNLSQTTTRKVER